MLSNFCGLTWSWTHLQLLHLLLKTLVMSFYREHPKTEMTISSQEEWSNTSCMDLSGNLSSFAYLPSGENMLSSSPSQPGGTTGKKSSPPWTRMVRHPPIGTTIMQQEAHPAWSTLVDCTIGTVPPSLSNGTPEQLKEESLKETPKKQTTAVVAWAKPKRTRQRTRCSLMPDFSVRILVYNSMLLEKLQLPATESMISLKDLALMPKKALTVSAERQWKILKLPTPRQTLASSPFSSLCLCSSKSQTC